MTYSSSVYSNLVLRLHLQFRILLYSGLIQGVWIGWLYSYLQTEVDKTVSLLMQC